MFAFLLVLFAALCLSALLLALEAGTGRLVGRSRAGTNARAAIFFAGAVAGSALLVTVSPREWMLLLALGPITLLSVLRFAMLANGWWTGWRLTVYTAALLLAAVALCMPWMPRPLDRGALLEGLRGGRPTFAPDSISPDALRPVRA
jgi:hypothetical protein